MMRWWSSLIRGRRRRGWTQISIMDDQDELGTDELMRMAMGQYEDHREQLNVDSISDDDDDDDHSHDQGGAPVFRHLQPFVHTSSSQSLLSVSSAPLLPESNDSDASSQETTSESEHSCGLRKLAFPQCNRYLVLLSVLVAMGFLGLTVGLGIYSLIIYNPDQLVIDKSVKSFSIPNHKAYKNFEAMMMARKDNSSMGRVRRDANMNMEGRHRWRRDVLHAKEKQMLRETDEVLQQLNMKNTGFVHKKKSASPPYLWSLNSESNEPSSSEGFSIGSTVSKLLQRIKRSSREINCIFEYQSIARWRMHIIYLAQGNNDTNMFTKERLQTAHDIEKKIVQHPGFHDFCLRDPRRKNDPTIQRMNGCVPLNSLLTYFYPSQDSDGNVFYDGLGTNIDDIDSALKLAMNHESFYYYVDEKINKTYQRSHLLRSEILFGAPLRGFSCVGDQRKDQDEKFKDFVVTYINMLSKSSTDKVRVLYGGNEIFDYEVTTSFWSDVRLAIISLIAIFLLMLLLSLSLYLTVVGVVVIAVSFPISLFFYRVVFRIDALGILNGAAAFVIIGIGVDDVFVFVNIYRQSSYIKRPWDRILHTVKTAGVATFFTSFTTAAAFAANLSSSIPAVYEFGLFMSLVVSSCWISVFVLMPPMLYLHACFLEPLEHLLFSCCSCAKPADQSHYDNSVQQFSQQQTSERRLYQDDDVPMLDIEIEEPSGYPETEDDLGGMDDDDMLLMDNPYSDTDGPAVSSQTQPPQSTSGEGCADICEGGVFVDNASYNNICLGRFIQKLLMFLTNRIVIRGRYFFLGFYAVILIASCALMAQLRPSTHPPQLFRPDTNIQQLLDLKANFTIIEAIRCDQCSAYYQVSPTKVDETLTAPVSLPPPPPQPIKPMPSVLPPHHHDYFTTENRSLSVWTTGRPGQSDDAVGSQSSGLVQDIASIAQRTHSIPLKMLWKSLSKLLPQSPASAVPSSNSNSMHQDVTESALDHAGGTDSNPEPAIKSLPSGVPPPPLLPRQHETDGPSLTPGDDGHRTAHASTQSPGHGWDNRLLSTHKPTQQQPTSKPKPHPASKTSSVDENFNACKGQSCNDLKDRPLMESGATVYVVFGIKGINRSSEEEGHVIDQFKGQAVFDSKFAEAFDLTALNPSHLSELCKICNILSNRTDLVKEGSAQCLPYSMYFLQKVLKRIPECSDLPQSLFIYHHQAPAHAEGGLDSRKRLLWLAFAFESTTSEGQAYFEAYKQYEKWEALMSHIKHNVLSPDSPLQSIFQTSEFWTKVLMEVVAVNSAIYGLVLSMIICIMAVAVFTGHLVLLAIVVVTITAVICCVVGVFYLAGWEMGAVEAVSLSILVGSSVDYCVHIVEGYILIGRRMPQPYISSQPKEALRKQRASLAVRHIGVALVCSALTTIIAAVPLTQTYIQPFAKFGSILLINTTVSMVMTLTLSIALLAIFGPARYRGTWLSHLVAFLVVGGVVGLTALALFIATTKGATIPGPSGSPLFS